MPKQTKAVEVSPNNPCPFLRALVQQRLLDGGVVAIGDVANTIVKVAKTGEGNPSLSSIAIRAIALIANGLSPFSIAGNALQGVRLDALRDGPLDKKGVGSQVLDSKGQANEAELERLGEFASEKTGPDGTSELGLDVAEIDKMMDANFARAQGHRRKIDRKLMNGEWPVLLQVIGKDGNEGRFLSVDDVRRLVVDRVLPDHMMRQLEIP